MNVKLHNITCDACVLDKTSYLNASPTEITAEFKRLLPQDLMNPVLITDNSITLASFNYVYIVELSAYYFVSKRLILSNNLYELHLEKDVLFSNLTKIKNSYAIVKRSYTHGNAKMRDETDAFAETENQFYTLLDTYKVSEFNLTDYDNYLVVYYDGHMNDTATYPESNTFSQPTNAYNDGIKPNIEANPYTLGYKNNTNYRIMNATHILKLMWAVGNDSQLLSMIKGIYKIPMQTSETNELKFRVVNTNQTKIYLGTTLIDLDYSAGVYTLYAPYSMRSRWVYESFQLYTTTLYQSYEYANPFSKYEIWCPFVGWVEIASSYLINKSVKIFYTFNLDNGETTCNFYDVSSDTIFMTTNANALLPISLSAINMREMEERKTALTLNTIIGGVSSAVTIIGGAYTGNAMAVASGVISAGKVASNAITGFTQLHPTGNVKMQNTNSSFQARIDFVLKRTYKDIKRLNISKLGRPCNDIYQLSTETGYFEATNLILSDNSGLCTDEIEKIKILIEKGVYAS